MKRSKREKPANKTKTKKQGRISPKVVGFSSKLRFITRGPNPPKKKGKSVGPGPSPKPGNLPHVEEQFKQWKQMPKAMHRAPESKEKPDSPKSLG